MKKKSNFINALKIKPLLFAIAAFFIAFTSCTIEKRVYLPGYHIESVNKGKHKYHKTIQEQIKSNPDLDYASEKSIVNIESQKINEALQFIASGNDDIALMADNQSKASSFTQISTPKENNNTEMSIPIEKKELKVKKRIGGGNSLLTKVTNWKAIASFISSIISSVLVISVIGAPLGLIFALFALILAMLAFKDFKNNPDKFKGKWLAIVGAILGGIALIVGLFISMVFLLFLLLMN